MNKFLKMISAITILIFIVTIVAMPVSVNAASSKYDSAMTEIATQRYQLINKYKEYLNGMLKFVNGLDKNKTASEIKIQIIDKAKSLEKSYSSIYSIPKTSNQIINTVINANATSTANLVEVITSKINSLLGNGSNAIESLAPDVSVNNVVATTAGERCGDSYKVKLAGKIYYADVDTNGKPTSSKWVYLIHGAQMNGQSMADALGQMYLDQGYNVLAPDTRGYGSSEGSVSMGYVESLDVWDWLTYLNNTYGNKCQQVIIHGMSLGGATTLFASGIEVNGKTLKDQHVIGLVEDSGYTSLTGVIKEMIGNASSNANLSNELVAKILGISEKDNLASLSNETLTEESIKKLLVEEIGVGLTEENFDQYQNALDSLNKSNLPLLIVHGTRDAIISNDNSTEVYNVAMSNSKIPYVQRFSATGEQHEFITFGLKYNVYEGHLENFISNAQAIASGKTVNKISNYKEEAEQRISSMQQLIKAFKMIKKLLKRV